VEVGGEGGRREPFSHHQPNGALNAALDRAMHGGSHSSNDSTRAIRTIRQAKAIFDVNRRDADHARRVTSYEIPDLSAVIRARNAEERGRFGDGGMS
jgi:hypothetical protein